MKRLRTLADGSSGRSCSALARIAWREACAVSSPTRRRSSASLHSHRPRPAHTCYKGGDEVAAKQMNIKKS